MERSWTPPSNIKEWGQQETEHQGNIKSKGQRTNNRGCEDWKTAEAEGSG
jgi:hypothetical protein